MTALNMTRVGPSHPDLQRMAQPDAERLPDGPCRTCQQPRPLFRLTQVQSWREEHDCPDCYGHDRQETTRLALCARCYSSTPPEITETP